MGPMNPEPGTSTLQSISDQRRLSEQPEDLQSIHTPDDDPEPIDKGKGWEDPPPGDNNPDDDPDDDPQDDDEEDGKSFSKSSYWPSTNPFPNPPEPRSVTPRFTMAVTKRSYAPSSYNACLTSVTAPKLSLQAR